MGNWIVSLGSFEPTPTRPDSTPPADLFKSNDSANGNTSCFDQMAANRCETTHN